jgi:uncharacterized membrane protein YccF (DUF307 family)
MVDGLALPDRWDRDVPNDHHDPIRPPSIQTAGFMLWPFGRAVVRRSDAGAPPGHRNIIWVVLVGWELAIGHLIAAALLTITIIGIPLALANLKLIPISLLPFGRTIVPIARARATGAVSV